MQTEPTTAELKSFFTEDKQHYSFYFDTDPLAPSLKVDLYLEARTILEEALADAIAQIPKKFPNVVLSPEIKLYKVRLTNKHLKPKTDMPAMSMFQKICDLKVEEFAVQLLDRQKCILESSAAEKQVPQLKQEESLTVQMDKLEVKEPATESKTQ